MTTATRKLALAPQDLSLCGVQSASGWLPSELPTCAGLTALRIQSCIGYEPTGGVGPLVLPSGPYLRGLRELFLEGCRFGEIPSVIAEATALEVLMCTNSASWRLEVLPPAPFKTAQAADVLCCLTRLRELRLAARDWEAEEQRSMVERLPGVRVSYQVEHGYFPQYIDNSSMTWDIDFNSVASCIGLMLVWLFLSLLMLASYNGAAEFVLYLHSCGIQLLLCLV